MKRRSFLGFLGVLPFVDPSKIAPAPVAEKPIVGSIDHFTITSHDCRNIFTIHQNKDGYYIGIRGDMFVSGDIVGKSIEPPSTSKTKI